MNSTNPAPRTAFLLFLFFAGCNSPTQPGNPGSVATNTNPRCQPPVTPAPVLTSQLVPEFVSPPLNSTDLGKVADDQLLPITLALGLNHETELAQVLSDIYQPGSPGFHQFLQPEEFRARFSPTDAQISKTISFLTTHGFQGVAADENRLLIRAQASASVINQTLQTELHEFVDASGEVTNAAVFEIQIPEGLGVRAVHGLQSFTKLMPHLVPAITAGPVFSSFSGPGGGLSPSDIRSAYNLQTSLTSGIDGTGQVLALFELDGYRPSDITTYENQFGIPHVPLQNVLVDGVSGIATAAGIDEVTLDIELMTAVAPHAAKILVYEGQNTEQGVLNLYNRIAQDNQAKVISTSWGEDETQTSPSFLQSENTIFMQMAAQGQTVFAASGDTGAVESGTLLGVSDPASQPFVTGVGGTQLFMSAGAYDHETTWNSGSSTSGAGGGGISAVWSQPSWQSGAVPPQSLGSSAMRNVPDVSLHANSNLGYSIYSQGHWTIMGGTSCAAPIWAAFTALVNQKRGSSGLGALGFANPLLYQIGESAKYGSDFFDIKDGSTNLYYPAVTGRDDATGWGSFNGANLLADLAVAPAGPVAVSCR